MRLGVINQEEIITNVDVHRTQSDFTAQGLKTSKKGHVRHITERRNFSLHNLSKLYRFYNMPVEIKTYLVKTLILPILDYLSVPTQDLSTTENHKNCRTEHQDTPQAKRFHTHSQHNKCIAIQKH